MDKLATSFQEMPEDPKTAKKVRVRLNFTSLWGWFLVMVLLSSIWFSINLFLLLSERQHISELIRIAEISHDKTIQRNTINELLILTADHFFTFIAGEACILAICATTPLILRAFIKRH